LKATIQALSEPGIDCYLPQEYIAAVAYRWLQQAIEPLLWTLYWFLRFGAHPNDPLADKPFDLQEFFIDKRITDSM
jgi:hypothetical protein